MPETTTVRTPTALLRAAVTVLRCEHEHPSAPPGGSFFKQGPCVHCGLSRSVTLEAARMVPRTRLRELLAVWLDDHAKDHDVYDCNYDDDDGFCPALGVARALLGEATNV